MGEIRVYPDEHQLMQATANEIVSLAHDAIAKRGRFSLVLSGGSTPKALFMLLATEDFASRLEWGKIHVFWGDERCVPPDHEDSNYRMAHELLLDKVPLPPEQIHRMHGEEEPSKAASDYEQTLREFFGDVTVPRFDFILLGIGDDGHTASLFPGTAAVHEQSRWVVADYVESKKVWRLTMTPVAINNAAYVAFLVTGTAKAERIRDVLKSDYEPVRMPSQAIRPDNGKLVWWLDSAAAVHLQG